MHRVRRHAAGVLLAIALSGAIAAHHSGIAMGDMHHDGMSAAIEMCVAAFTAVGAAVVAAAIGILALGRWLTTDELFPAGGLVPAGARAPEARAGPPPPFSQLCVWRR
jgi:hypothetical protein